jgi:hypothetical protein
MLILNGEDINLYYSMFMIELIALLALLTFSLAQVSSPPSFLYIRIIQST